MGCGSCGHRYNPSPASPTVKQVGGRWHLTRPVVINPPPSAPTSGGSSTQKAK